jgi:acyl carrier protein phosphodiesterase
VIIGNFIGDYVKGRDYNRYKPGIKRGILLHRRIDSYTDNHKIVIQSKSYFAPQYRKYAGIIIDILYDHYLVMNWNRYSPESIETMKEYLFDCLKKNYAVLPERVQFFVPSFIKNDWIGVYSTVDGIVQVLSRMAMRTTLPDYSEFAREVIHKYYVQLESEFLTYFPDIIKYVIRTHGMIIPLKDNSILK